MNGRKADKILELNRVSLYRDTVLLNNINWEVKKGQHWVVLGRNGAGKTLLLKILAGYIWPSRGRVSVLGKRFGAVDLRNLRKKIGWVSSALREKIPGKDNAMKVVLSGEFASFGLYEDPSPGILKKAERLLADTGLAHLAERRFSDLSQGEQQRVLLARSLLSEPELLILDEPCAGLDFAASHKFLNLINSLTRDQEGPALIMVTHRVSDIVAGITHGLLLHQGRAAASGPIDEVMEDGLLSRTLEIKVSVRKNNGYWSLEPV